MDMPEGWKKLDFAIQEIGENFLLNAEPGDEKPMAYYRNEVAIARSLVHIRNLMKEMAEALEEVDGDHWGKRQAALKKFKEWK